jgi:hypothetical protein
MKAIGQGIAFASLVCGATVLEIYDKPAAGLWVLVGLWVLFGSIGDKEKGDN